MKTTPPASPRTKRRPATYTVKAAARMAGVSENQVRLWERRFGLLDPVRAENGYRLYTADDVAILAHLGRETGQGVPIRMLAERGRRVLLAEATRSAGAENGSRIARVAGNAGSEADALSTGATAVDLLAALPRGSRRATRGTKSAAPVHPITLPPSLLEALTRGRAAAFEALLDELETGRPFPDAVLDVELPVLARIGEMTTSGTISIAAEHVATDVIRRRIITFVHGLEIPVSGNPLLIAGVPGDHHEVGLLALVLHLALRRISSVYLGANLPLEDLEQAATRMAARAVLLAAAAPLTDEGASALAAAAERLTHRGVVVAFGGYEASKRARFFRERGFTVPLTIAEAADWAARRITRNESLKGKAPRGSQGNAGTRRRSTR